MQFLFAQQLQATISNFPFCEPFKIGTNFPHGPVILHSLVRDSLEATISVFFLFGRSSPVRLAQSRARLPVERRVGRILGLCNKFYNVNKFGSLSFFFRE